MRIDKKDKKNPARDKKATIISPQEYGSENKRFVEDQCGPLSEAFMSVKLAALLFICYGAFLLIAKFFINQ